MKRFLCVLCVMALCATFIPQAEAGGLLGRIFAPRVAVVGGGNVVAVRAPFVNIGVGRQFVAVPQQRVFVQRQFVPQQRVFVQRQFVQQRQFFVPQQRVFVQQQFAPSHSFRSFNSGSVFFSY